MAENVSNFKIDRIKHLKTIYTDEVATKRLKNQTFTYRSTDYTTAQQVRAGLTAAIQNRENVVQSSQELFATNPIYASILEYLSNLYMWRYKVTPHKVYTKSKSKTVKELKEIDFQLMYNLMLEAVDGLNIETKFPSLLTLLFMNGAVYISTACDEDSITVDSLLLPDKYCRKIGETQYGTAIIEFDFSYFQSLGMTGDELNEYFKMFPKEFKTCYNRYLKDSSNMRWQALDPHFSTGVLLNDVSLPTFFYLYGGILDYEKYQDNELERNENLLKYIVVHTMPIYQNELIFEVDEVAAIHKSLAKIVNTNDKARLITTYGDVHVEKVSENDTAENQVLAKAYKAIFNNGGFNSAIFTGESVEALEKSVIRDKTLVWKFIQQFLNFYTIAINNWFDFKMYEADIDILPISLYTYNDDIEIYRSNATLGVGKLDYIIASGIKQKNIQDQFTLEKFLNLDSITPMQSSYTQTAEDRQTETKGKNNTGRNETSTNSEQNEESSTNTNIEPLDTVEQKDSETSEN